MTTAKEKIIRYYSGTEGSETAVRLVDLAEQVVKSRKMRLSGFLSPFEMEIAEAVAANYDDVKVSFDGGYIGAERQRAVFMHEDFRGAANYEIAVLKAEWNATFAQLYHRDVLGSLMGLGIDRALLGDLLVSAGAVKILADKKIVDYLLTNLVQIGNAKVTCSIAELGEIAPREERSKDISATVASLRIDSVVAAGFGISRSRAAADVEADKLKLNWQQVKSSSQAVKEGDVISLRGRGRLEVTEIRGQTKKGRIGVSLRRFF